MAVTVLDGTHSPSSGEVRRWTEKRVTKPWRGGRAARGPHTFSTHFHIFDAFSHFSFQLLIGIHGDCVRLGERLSDDGVEWKIRHIYREFNQTVDSLSYQAIDEEDTNGASVEW